MKTMLRHLVMMLLHLMMMLHLAVGERSKSARRRRPLLALPLLPRQRQRSVSPRESWTTRAR